MGRGTALCGDRTSGLITEPGSIANKDTLLGLRRQ